jgi:U3 small nucleolar RNA-associated protein 14
MESSIDRLLKSAKMREEDIEKMEEIQLSHLPDQEVSARRNELHKKRELMFRHKHPSKSTPKSTGKSPSPESQRTEGELLASTPSESNPWLPSSDIAMKAPRKKNEVVVGKDSAIVEKSKNRLKKRTKKQDEEKKKAQEDANVEISMTDVLVLNGEAKGPKPFEQRDLVALAFAGDNVVQV